MGRLSLPVRMETLPQERHEGHRSPECHKSRMLVLESPRPGTSRLTLGSLWSFKSIQWERRGWPRRAWSGQRGGHRAHSWPQPIHGCALCRCASFLLPTSPQQVTPPDCLLILISLGQGCPASQTALCPASHNSLIIMLMSTEELL